MPRYADAQFRWSEQAQTYVLSSGDRVSEQALTSDWLELNNSFSFHSRRGMHYTVRKQKGLRGSNYWYAYRRLHGRLVKRYLGRTVDLTLARLEEIAHRLESESEASNKAFHAPQTAALLHSTPDGLPAEKRLPSASAEAYPLLLSKLSQPRLPAFLLDRPRLFPLLDTGREGLFTLLSAPAGFGKTTLVSQWIAARRADTDFSPVAWVSLEVVDNDPLRFWRYLTTACRAFGVDLTQVHNAFAALTPQPPFLPANLSQWLSILLNALAQAPAGGILVLEDYHVITEPVIHEALSFFLNHLPKTIHLLMITRSDPPFPLASLRAHNALVEIRTADLRFTQEETATLLHHALPFPLDATMIQRLHAQLEGWGAGLHLTKLALQRIPLPLEDAQTITLFSQNSASFQEYFVTEVLNLQAESVQQFLLQTSLLPRLTASLCDAITEQMQSQDMLTELAHANLFIEQLDSKPLLQCTQFVEAHQWYRYHALFAEAMRHEARRRWSETYLQQISARASLWYERCDFLPEAIDAALAARDYPRTAMLLVRFLEERTIPGEVQEPHTLLRWFKQLPEAHLEQNPVLCLYYATALLLQSSAWTPAASSLPMIEKLLSMAEHRCRAEQNFSQLGGIFAFRALFALRLDKMQVAVTCAKQALDWLPQTQDIWRGLSATITATGWLESGRFQQARDFLGEAHTQLGRTNSHLFYQVATIKLAQVLVELGEIQQATPLYRQALEASTLTVNENLAKPLAHWRCTALSSYAILCYTCNELEQASRLLQEAIVLSRTHLFLHHEVHALLVLARVQQAQGQVFVAQQQLAELLERIPASQAQLVQDIQTAQARLALSIGDHMTLQHWALLRTPHPDFAQRAEANLLQTRWLRIQGKEEEAQHQLEQIILTAREAGHTRSMLEAMIEMALSTLACRRKVEAQHMLREGLILALPNQPVRLFLDAGEPMAMLLRSLLPQTHDQPLRAYIRTLLGAFPTSRQRGAPDLAAPLIEPLSPQEMRVLRLLAEHRTNAKIAEMLVVSINTVRTQVQSIYNKLGTHRRSETLEVARDLNLL
ncbi:LuxR C-terminal-related transcriptional regulator [Dictyobacter aurantiacus]|uniref:LuxR family transcriptional regulator n=1 Tax=Dictyobacter aurantiacus TaxID=1936993 RepID=A0A401ZNL7_9CHLR|nr:LuxR C-terminal-related transcriptional regulator [Dictyobacter aurantiacus]GCE08443.1 LuxR family transcriptional regulator [Dictyobacter aurantiacus]